MGRRRELPLAYCFDGRSVEDGNRPDYLDAGHRARLIDPDVEDDGPVRIEVLQIWPCWFDPGLDRCRDNRAPDSRRLRGSAGLLLRTNRRSLASREEGQYAHQQLGHRMLGHPAAEVGRTATRASAGRKVRPRGGGDLVAGAMLEPLSREWEDRWGQPDSQSESGVPRACTNGGAGHAVLRRVLRPPVRPSRLTPRPCVDHAVPETLIEGDLAA